MRRKIGVFCPTLNVCGGGEFVAVALANALAQSNHKVILFANSAIDSKAIKNYFGEALHSTIQTVIQPTHFTPRGLIDFYQTIIHAYTAKTKCDLFVDAFSNCVFPWAEVTYIHFPYLNQYAFNKKFPYLNNPRLQQAGTLPQVLLEKNLVSYKKRLVLANSYYTAAEVKAFSGKQVEVLYPPFSSVISSIGRQTTKTPNQKLVVTTSRLEPNKLLERIPHIAAQTSRDIQFAVIGRLCNKQTLTNLQTITKKLGLTDRVKFYPDAPAQQKIDLLKRAKVYLHTMVGEHFGISIVEAMALGCIPIVHDSGGMKEFVPVQYRYSNLKEAADKIDSVMGDWSPECCADVKRIADQFSTSNFSKRFMYLLDRHSQALD